MTDPDILVLDAFLPYRLSVASNAVSNLIARAYRDQFGLRVPEWRVVAILAQTPGLTPQTLCARGQMDKITVSRAAQALRARNLITATDNPADNRSHCLALTPTGWELYRAVVPTARALEQRMLSALSAAEVKVLADLLVRVTAAAQA